MTRLEVKTSSEGDSVRLSLSGELDLASAPRVEEELRSVELQSPPLIVLDLRELTFMDSTGLRLLVLADSRARDAGRRLTIVPGPDTVQRVFHVTGLDNHLDLVAEEPPAHGGEPSPDDEAG
jgi:anti-sigma B factor antagonist